MSVSFFLADECTWGENGHSGPVTAVLPINSDSLITGSRDSTIRKWKKRKIEDGTSNWVQQKCLRGHKDWISDICPGPDPSILFSSSTSGVLRVWKEDEPQSAIVHKDFVECLAYCKAEELLVCGGLGFIAYYKPEQLERRCGIVVPNESIYSIAISEGGGPLVLAGGTNLMLYDIRESYNVPCWNHRGRGAKDDRPFPIRDISFADDASRALSAGFAGVYFWDLRTRKCVSRYAGRNRSYWAVDSANGWREFVAGGKVVDSTYQGEVVRADLLTGETIQIQTLGSPVLSLRVAHQRHPDIWITDEEGNTFCHRLEPPINVSAKENSPNPLSPKQLPPRTQITAQAQYPNTLQQEQIADICSFESPSNHRTVLNELSCPPPPVELPAKSVKSDDTMLSDSLLQQPSKCEIQESGQRIECVLKTHFRSPTENRTLPDSRKDSPILKPRSIPFDSPELIPLQFLSSFPPLPSNPTPCLPKNRRAVRAEFNNDMTVVLVEYTNPKSFEAWSVLTQRLIPQKHPVVSWEQLQQRYFQIFRSLTWCRLSIHLGFVSIELKESLHKMGFMGDFSLAQVVLKSIFRGWLKANETSSTEDEKIEGGMYPLSMRRASCSLDLPLSKQTEEELSASAENNCGSFSPRCKGSPAGGPDYELNGPFFVCIHQPKIRLAMTVDRDSSVINWRNKPNYNFGPLIPNWAMTELCRDEVTEKPKNRTRFLLEKLGDDVELKEWPRDHYNQMPSWMTASELEEQLLVHHKTLEKSWKIYLKCRGVPLEPEWNLQTIEEFFVRSPERLPQNIVDMSDNKRLKRRKKVKDLVIQYGLQKNPEYIMDEETEEFITYW